MSDIKTIKGLWVTPNKFITEKEEEIEVQAQTYVLSNCKDKWPFECYINYYTSDKYNIICEAFPLEHNSSL